MAGGFKKFGPTYNSTEFLRLGYEGILNGSHSIDATVTTNELTGKFAAIGANGVKLADATGNAVGLFREELADMVNASNKASFYFRGGEYYVALARTGLSAITDIAIGDEITSNADGELVKKDLTNTGRALGVVTHKGAYTAGNMYANAGSAANGGDFVGFILFV